MLSLRLHTDRPDEMIAFYARTLGLEVVCPARRSFTVRAGASTIEFTASGPGAAPFYHFALTIAENKMPGAREWLADRCRLLRDRETGNEETFFAAWNAHSVYFHDPAGNIVEFIARHTLDNGADGPFGADDILEVSEIGLVVPKRDRAIRRIVEVLALRPYLGSDFFLGDARGLILLPEPGYPWLPERAKGAAIFPTHVTISGHGTGRVRFDDLPYEIEGID